jgi:hypothetical protein
MSFEQVIGFWQRQYNNERGTGAKEIDTSNRMCAGALVARSWGVSGPLLQAAERKLSKYYEFRNNGLESSGLLGCSACLGRAGTHFSVQVKTSVLPQAIGNAECSGHEQTKVHIAAIVTIDDPQDAARYIASIRVHGACQFIDMCCSGLRRIAKGISAAGHVLLNCVARMGRQKNSAMAWANGSIMKLMAAAALFHRNMLASVTLSFHKIAVTAAFGPGSAAVRAWLASPLLAVVFC